MENEKPEIIPTEQQFPGPSEFVHLHNHTIFSPLDGVASPEQYFKACAERKWPAFAVTEHSNLSSIPDNYLAAKEFKIKYLCGCEFYYCDFEQKRRELAAEGVKIGTIKQENPDLASRITKNRHLTVIAKNMNGYANLLKINIAAWEKGYYYRPRIWFDLLAEHKDDLIILSGCLNGPINHELQAGNFSSKGEFLGAIDYVDKFHKTFGDNFYIELQMPGVEGDLEIFRQLSAIADHKKIKTVITNDCWNMEVPVLTETGNKPINMIQIGERVWTHCGRLREVLCIGKRKIRDNEKIYGFHGGKLIYCTENHKVFALRSGKRNFWRVDQLKADDMVCITRLPLALSDLQTIRLSDYIKSNRLIVKQGLVYPFRWNKRPVQDEYKLTDEILYMIGCYVAEGSADGYRLSFASHKKEQIVRNNIVKFFRQLGLRPQEKRVTENGYAVRICCSAWTYFLQDCCGDGKHKKRLPPFWTQLSARQLKILLRGYLDGDGCHSRRVSFTVSRYLFSDLLQAFSALKLKIGSWLRPAKENVRIKKKNGKIVLSKYSEGFYLICPKETYKSLGYEVGDIDISKQRNKAFVDKYGLWITNPFRTIDLTTGEVWCIQVDEDSSFCVGIASSNCHYLSKKDFQLQKIMMAIDQDTTIDDPDLFYTNSDEQYLKTRYELRATFHQKGYDQFASNEAFERACDNTLEVAERCQSFKPNLDPKLPKIENAEETLVKLALAGLREKGFDKDKKKYMVDGKEVTYYEQMQVELKRILEKGFASYFLMTQDLIQSAIDKGYWLGPGRGCVIPESKILTLSGFKPIIDVSIGDKIKDGFGTAQIVENKLIYDVNEELFEIMLENEKTYTLTSDHKLYIIRNNKVILLKVLEIKDTDEIIGISGEDQQCINQSNLSVNIAKNKL